MEKEKFSCLSPKSKRSSKSSYLFISFKGIHARFSTFNLEKKLFPRFLKSSSEEYNVIEKSLSWIKCCSFENVEFVRRRPFVALTGSRIR